MKTITRNVHLVLSHDEWKALLNCVDLADAIMHGWPKECVDLKDVIILDFKENFSHQFLEKLSNKVSWS